MKANDKKMKVEVWSDIMCPFCYLGKHRFEKALEQFSDRDNIEMIWRSFMLNPELKTDTSISVYEYLSREKGFPVENAKQMNSQLAESGREIGLDYNFDKVVVANTFRAHNLLHYAKEHGKQNEAKESLLKAYFSEGRNVDDIQTLTGLGKELGLDADDLKEALEKETYADEVWTDVYESRQLGIRGVPFFVFNNKYAVSGAQDTSVFLQVLEKSFSEWRKDNPEIKLEIIQGKSCSIDGECE